MSTVEELTQQVKDLSLLVKKQSELLTKTGEQVLSLQVQNQKRRVSEFDPTGSSRKARSQAPNVDTSDFATNEDIVQLVGELQGQLEILEERSIRRLINSQKKEGETLAPVLNNDGEEPDVKLFPKDIQSLTKISDEDLVQLARFYELLPPTEEERKKFEEFVEGDATKLDDEVVKVDPSSYSKVELVEAFDQLARFIGVSVRRGVDAW